MNARVLGIGWQASAGMSCRAGAGMGQARTNGAAFAMERGPLAIPSRSDLFSEPDQRFGRLDDFSKIGLAALTMALRDAGLDDWDAKRPVGIVAATALGCLATDSSYMNTVLEIDPAMAGTVSLASPHLFAFTLPNVFLGEAAIRFGLTGPMFALAEPGGSDLAGVRQAMDLLADGECEVILAGCCDLETIFQAATAAGTNHAATAAGTAQADTAACVGQAGTAAGDQTARQSPTLPSPLPGAVFLALAAEDWPGLAGLAAPLASLRMDKGRQILCNGRSAATMTELARLCLGLA